jgi:2-dehydro-3-deoxyphosphooctonate aldolase (KDO 8-P synthase)
VAESLELCIEVARACRAVCKRLGLGYVFKASYDKANRTAADAPRGPGLTDGLRILRRVRDEVGVPVCTDVHETSQVADAASVADMLQIPAFLSRQTDLIVACAHSGRCVNIKKGQFMAPWDMVHPLRKALAAGNRNVLLTERGASFGYNTLVLDPCSLPIMRALGHPVCMDVTHAVQAPGGAGDRSGGRSDLAPAIARAACAAGVDALFIETHPQPECAMSDAAIMVPLDALEGLLTVARDVDAVVRQAGVLDRG